MKMSLTELNDVVLIGSCKDCVSWRKTGVVPENGVFKYFVSSNSNLEPREIEHALFKEALVRFKDIAAILFKEFPEEFIK